MDIKAKKVNPSIIGAFSKPNFPTNSLTKMEKAIIANIGTAINSDINCLIFM